MPKGQTGHAPTPVPHESAHRRKQERFPRCVATVLPLVPVFLSQPTYDDHDACI